MTGPAGVGAKAGVPATPASPVSIPRRFAPRVPLLTAAAAFAVGIVADRALRLPVPATLLGRVRRRVHGARFQVAAASGVGCHRARSRGPRSGATSPALDRRAQR